MKQSLTRKSGTTVMEVIVACSLLATTAASMSLMSWRMQRGFQERVLVKRAWVEVCNARQQIGSWQTDDVQLERILSLPIAEALRRDCVAIEWVARVEEIQQPLPGKCIFIGLKWTRAEQQAAPLGITFWHSSTSSWEESR